MDFSFVGSSLTGWRPILLSENIVKFCIIWDLKLSSGCSLVWKSEREYLRRKFRPNNMQYFSSDVKINGLLFAQKHCSVRDITIIIDKVAEKYIFFLLLLFFTTHNAFKMCCSSISMTSVTTACKNSCINRLLKPFVPHSWASTLLFHDLSSANKHLSPCVTGCLLTFTKQKL